HDAEDEMFLVVDGCFDMLFRDHSITIEKGEFIIIPKGVEHCPVAKSEVSILLFEPIGTLNTGDAEDSELSRTQLSWI
ncbi:MAG: cupin domain-containing protein, partial [Saprospiraceae bacterium]|nr:cupin domain-containing protein [Saprospiraceae bacterium]